MSFPNTTAYEPTYISGLQVQIAAGTTSLSGVLVNSPTQSLTMSAATTTTTTNFIFVNTTTGLVQTNTTGFTATSIPIAIAITNPTQNNLYQPGVQSLQDVRPTFNR